MSKRVMPILIIGLVAATAANAQSRGGRGRGGGTQAPPTTTTPTATPSTPRPAPSNSVAITGVVQSIDPEHDQVTIAYDEVQALNWPHGTMPFTVSKSELLKGVTVGEKVRFKLESQQISDLTPY